MDMSNFNGVQWVEIEFPRLFPHQPHGEPDAQHGETASRDERSDETYTCWDAEGEDAEDEGEERRREESDAHKQDEREEEEEEDGKEHVCAIVKVTIPTDEHRTCQHEVRVPCEDDRKGLKEPPKECVQMVEVRC